MILRMCQNIEIIYMFGQMTTEEKEQRAKDAERILKSGPWRKWNVVKLREMRMSSGWGGGSRRRWSCGCLESGRSMRNREGIWWNASNTTWRRPRLKSVLPLGRGWFSSPSNTLGRVRQSPPPSFARRARFRRLGRGSGSWNAIATTSRITLRAGEGGRTEVRGVVERDARSRPIHRLLRAAQNSRV